MIPHLNLSWMSPVKVRRIAIGGNKQMVLWDGLNLKERLKIYNSGIEFRPETDRVASVPSYRIGDVYSPRYLSARRSLVWSRNLPTSLAASKTRSLTGTTDCG
jgi:hypothetical protein